MVFGFRKQIIVERVVKLAGEPKFSEDKRIIFCYGLSNGGINDTSKKVQQEASMTLVAIMDAIFTPDSIAFHPGLSR